MAGPWGRGWRWKADCRATWQLELGDRPDWGTRLPRRHARWGCWQPRVVSDAGEYYESPPLAEGRLGSFGLHSALGVARISRDVLLTLGPGPFSVSPGTAADGSSGCNMSHCLGSSGYPAQALLYPGHLGRSLSWA